jgi:hypothetical protein
MNKLLKLPIVSLLLFIACTDHPKKEATKPVKKGTQKTIAARQEKILQTISQAHKFSNPLKPDQFTLTLSGNSLLNGTISFTITSTDGQNIYSESFPSSYLLNYDIDPTATKKEKEAFVLKRMKEFFGEENFSAPAVKASDTFDPEYADKQVWELLRSDRDAVGFTYLVGEEDSRSIAWSKKQKKVVRYFECC